MPDPSDRGESRTITDPYEFGRLWLDLSLKSQKAMMVLADAPKQAGEIPARLAQAASATFVNLYLNLLRDPVALVRSQAELMYSHVELWRDLVISAKEGKSASLTQRDRRFRNEEWETNLAFKALVRSYLIGAGWMRSLVDKGELDHSDRTRATFFIEQIIDATAPTNFAFTNPDVLKKTFETGGANLLKGYSNFLDDILANAGHVRRVDDKAFDLGVNIAATKGSVVFRNAMIELIQYEPTTDNVSKVPLLLIPPWVNKYYLFDLQQKTSFIKWAVDQGWTVFAISWVNPDLTHADKDFEDYWLEGPQAALELIAKASGESKVNLLGYCLGGTLAATGLGYLAADNDERANSATMIAALTDFAEFGDFEVFLNEGTVEALKMQIRDKGYLDQAELSRLFSLLRANDLIWSSAISSYLLAEDAVASDLLFWFSDGIGMPAKMLDTFMRQVILDNALSRPGGLTVGNRPIDLSRVSTPLCFVSLKEDHVANWEATYRGALRFKAPKRFILGGSGHNAGTINPPAARKHGYWTNSAMPNDPKAWLEGAQRHEGSWWSEWSDWLKQQSGPTVASRRIVDGPLPVLEPAPGGYARLRR
jgi:poly[(R)-3-hydroxyalkanoate] polymerase subunit PhaC